MTPQHNTHTHTHTHTYTPLPTRVCLHPHGRHILNLNKLCHDALELKRFQNENPHLDVGNLAKVGCREATCENFFTTLLNQGGFFPMKSKFWSEKEERHLDIGNSIPGSWKSGFEPGGKSPRPSLMLKIEKSF